MKAIGLHEYLPIEEENSLIDMEVERPVATGRDILVKINAISVNPVDTKVRSPKRKRSCSENTWLGCEWCCCTNRRKLYVI